MNCLRCPSTVLEEHVREGVVVDVCPRCRGIWLDRGELEKLVARLRDDDDDDDRRRRRLPGRSSDERADANPPGKPDRRGGWMDRFTDFFD